MELPTDNFILLSLVNTRLRDGDTLQDFCADCGVEEEELRLRMLNAGYAFDEDENCFKGI